MSDIDAILSEIKYGARSDLVQIRVRIRARTTELTDPTVPDILTNIRVAPGVAVVRQVSPVVRIPGARDVLDLEIKYLPDSTTALEYIEILSLEMKKIPGIEIIKVIGVAGQPIFREDGNAIVY